MALKLAPSKLVLAIAALVLLAGCGTWWQQQQQAWQRRMAHERCLKQRSAIEQQMVLIRRDQQLLRDVAAQAYIPAPPPKPIDPQLASRFSELDRQLDEERYAAELSAWQQREQQRQQRWKQSQLERSARARAQFAQHTSQLATLDRSLVKDGKPDMVRFAAAVRCSKP